MRMLTAVLFTTIIFVGGSSAQEIKTPMDEPAVVKAVAPLFPLADEGKYAFGSVTVEIRVDDRGSVIGAKAIQGHPVLYRASEKAAQRWLFAASSLGTKVRTTRLTFIFKMMEDTTAEEDLSPNFMPPYQIEVRRLVPTVINREPAIQQALGADSP